jgi:hypothetical protein
VGLGNITWSCCDGGNAVEVKGVVYIFSTLQDIPYSRVDGTIRAV